MLLVIEPLLIRNGKYKAHRIIGRFTYVLVPCIIISIHFIAREAYLNAIANQATRHKAIAGLYFASYQIFDFFILYVLAIANKNRTPYHMRYMIATALAIAGAGFRRFFSHVMHLDGSEAVLYGFLVPDLLLVALLFMIK